MLSPIPLEVIVAYAIFSNFLYFQSKHAQNFRGESEIVHFLLTMCSALGLVYLIVFHTYTFWNFHWYYPIIMIAIGMISFSAFILLLRLSNGIKFFYSIGGLIIIPVSGVIMGKIFFLG